MLKPYVMLIFLSIMLFSASALTQPAIHFHIACDLTSECQELDAVWGEGKTYLVQKRPALTIYRENIVDIEMNEDPADAYVVQLDEDSAEILHRITADNTGSRLSIVYDNMIYSSPIIQAPILNGKFIFRYDKNYKIFSKISAEMGIHESIQQKRVSEMKRKENAYYFYMGFTILFTLLVAMYVLVLYVRTRFGVAEKRNKQE